MRPGLWIALAVGLTLGGCASVAPEDASDAPMIYACAAGKRFVASYALDGRVARVTVGGKTLTLRQARSASGALYASGTAQLFIKGAEAMLDGVPGGPYRKCTTG